MVGDFGFSDFPENRVEKCFYIERRILFFLSLSGSLERFLLTNFFCIKVDIIIYGGLSKNLENLTFVSGILKFTLKCKL